MKLGVIVPYRKRPTHLRKFKYAISEYLKNYDYELIVVEQNDDLPFNRGKLLNIGFQHAVRKGCDYVVFHDIDMLPIDVDYSHSDVPIHLATGFTNSDREIFDTYFGGVTLFPVDSFKKVNGYSNEYWGWGFEDDDLLLRLTEQRVFTKIKTLEVPKEATAGIYLHGDNSYVKCPNIIDITKDFTIHCTFKSDEIVPEFDKDFDEYCVFSIPGWDTSISYNSFNRYKFECWDIGKVCHQITSKYDYPKLTRITVTYNKSERLLIMYQDGVEIGRKEVTRMLLDTKSKDFFIGIATDERKSTGNRIVDKKNNVKKSFRGFVSEFAYWNSTLAVNEIREFTESYGMGFLYDYEQYSSSKDLKIYYDFKHLKLDNPFDYESGHIVNLVNSRHIGEVKNSIPKVQNQIEHKKISIPIRRNSTFEMLKHTDAGYKNGSWKSESTRLNQIKFYNEMISNETNLTNDGLSTLEYKKVSDISQEKYTLLSVKL